MYGGEGPQPGAPRWLVWLTIAALVFAGVMWAVTH